MKLPWRPTGGPSVPGTPGTEMPADVGHACPSLVKALDRCFKHDKPEILDLGPFCGSTAVQLANRGARVSVTEFQPPIAAPVEESRRPAVDDPPGPALRIDQDDDRFHLVLGWEHLDFTPPERLAEFGAELHRVLVPGGLVLLFALSNLSKESPLGRTLGRYRMGSVDDDKVVREAVPAGGRRRYTHPTREIERALAPLSIQGIHLQRNQMREFLALKRLTRS